MNAKTLSKKRILQDYITRKFNDIIKTEVYKQHNKTFETIFDNFEKVGELYLNAKQHTALHDAVQVCFTDEAKDIYNNFTTNKQKMFELQAIKNACKYDFITDRTTIRTEQTTMNYKGKTTYYQAIKQLGNIVISDNGQKAVYIDNTSKKVYLQK